MNRENQQSGSTDAARVRASFRSTWLSWTDPHTGDRLTVRMKSDTDYVSELVSEGFELIGALDAESDEIQEIGVAQRLGACEPNDRIVRRFASVAVEAHGVSSDEGRGPDGASGVRRSGNRRAG